MRKELEIYKFGTESVTNGLGVDLGKIGDYARQISSILNVIVVSSGARRAGEAIWKQSQEYENSKPITDRSLVTLGSAALYRAWQESLWERGRLGGEVPVTHREIEDIEEGPSFRRTLEENLDTGIVSIVNESPLSETELAKIAYGGDNDGLASHTAIFMGASFLGLMTNVEGLLDSNGRTIRQVAYDPEAHHQALLCAGELDEKGQGMPSKIRAAIEAAHAGVSVVVAQAGEDLDLVRQGKVGTHFAPRPQDM